MVGGRWEGIWEKEERGVMDLMISSRSLYLSFYCALHVSDEIEIPEKKLYQNTTHYTPTQVRSIIKQENGETQKQ